MSEGKTATRVTIVGAAELSAQLAQIRQSLAGPIAVAGLMAAGIKIQAAWKESIQSYPLIDTGSYLRSVSVETAREGSGHVVIVGTDITNPPYPFFLEYGTSRMPPKPHVRPMMDRMQEPAMNELAEVIGQLIDRVR